MNNLLINIFRLQTVAQRPGGLLASQLPLEYKVAPYKYPCNKTNTLIIRELSVPWLKHVNRIFKMLFK